MSISAPFFCDHCGAANRPQAQFCRVCGQSLHLPFDTSSSTVAATTSTTLTGPLTPQSMVRQRYMVLKQVGRGGFGAVYKALDTHLNDRVVAIKEMSQSTLQNNLNTQEFAEAMSAFRNEAVLLASLTHPHLPRIYEQFNELDRSYLVMDFIDGRTLEETLQDLKQRPGTPCLPVDDVINFALQLCSVLDYLHTRKPPIIFRDLKPANIMITSANHLYLIDFGIARYFKPGQQKDTTALGSYGYAPPEQYGKSQTTERADIYSLGATLHQLFSGDDPSETPFQFAPMYLSDPLLASLNALIMRMVDVDAQKRPATIMEVQRELQQVAIQYRYASANATGTVSLYTPKSTIVYPVISQTSPPVPAISPVAIPPSPLTTAGGQKSGAKAAAQPIVYPQPNLLFVALGHQSRITALSWSPDGKTLVSSSYDKTVRLWNAQTGQHTGLYKRHRARVTSVMWSPDGKMLASSSNDKSVHLWDASTCTTSYRFEQHHSAVNDVAWSPDGKSLVSSSVDGIVLVWDAWSHIVRLTYRQHSESVQVVAWSPDGRYIASAGKDKIVYIWEVEKMRQKRSLLTSFFSTSLHMLPVNGQQSWTGFAGAIYALAWSPDGKSLVASCSDGQVYVRNVALNKNLSPLRIDHSTIKNALAWSPDGKSLAVGGNDKSVHIWNAVTEREAFTYTGHSGYVTAVTWSPDGTRIASAGVDHTIQVWQAR
jgi:WD40 repeat protein